MNRATEELRSLWADVDAAVQRCGEYGFPPQVTAEGIRYATELMRLALELHGHAQDPDRPHLYPMITPTLRWGWDNPYTTYHHAAISGSDTYRLFGQRNTSIYLGLTVYGGGDERAGAMPLEVISSTNDTAIPLAADGSFQLIISPDPAPTDQDGAWLTVDRDASSLWVRQYFERPQQEIPASIHIERLTAAGPPQPLDDQDLARRFAAARGYFAAMWAMSEQMISTWGVQGLNEFLTRTRGGTPAEGRPSGFMYPTRDNLYVFGHYDLKQDQALLVTLKPIVCRYWSFYLGTLFQQSLPYGSQYGLITKDNAVFSQDGTVTIVISAEDPGAPNWLPTQGHHRGVMCLRWLLPEDDDEAQAPICHLVSFGQISGDKP